MILSGRAVPIAVSALILAAAGPALVTTGLLLSREITSPAPNTARATAAAAPAAEPRDEPRRGAFR